MVESDSTIEQAYLLYGIQPKERLSALYYEIGRANKTIVDYVENFRRTNPSEVERIKNSANEVLAILVNSREEIIKEEEGHSTFEGSLRQLAAGMTQDNERINPKLVGLLMLLDDFPQRTWSNLTNDQQKQAYMFFFYEGNTDCYPFEYNRILRMFSLRGRGQEFASRWKETARSDYKTEYDFFELVVDWSYPLSEIRKSFEEHIRTHMPQRNRDYEESLTLKTSKRASHSYWHSFYLPFTTNECLFLLGAWNVLKANVPDGLFNEVFSGSSCREFFVFDDTRTIRKKELDYNYWRKVYDSCCYVSQPIEGGKKIGWEAFERHTPLKLRRINQLIECAFALPPTIENPSKSLEISRFGLL